MSATELKVERLAFIFVFAVVVFLFFIASLLFKLILVAQLPNFRVVRLPVQFGQSRDILEEVGLVENLEQKVLGKRRPIIELLAL